MAGTEPENAQNDLFQPKEWSFQSEYLFSECSKTKLKTQTTSNPAFAQSVQRVKKIMEKMSAQNPGGKKFGHFFRAASFRVTNDGLSKRWTSLW